METDEADAGNGNGEDEENPNTSGPEIEERGGGKENVDPNKGLVPLKLKLRDVTVPPGNAKPRARQLPTTGTQKRKIRQKVGDGGGGETPQKGKVKQRFNGATSLNGTGTTGDKEGGAAETMIFLSNTATAANSEEITNKH